MKRRGFLKLSLVSASALLAPLSLQSKELNLSSVGFSSSIYEQNSAQSIIVFLYGGASQLSGNMSNIEEIKTNSQSEYDSHFRGVSVTQNGCWQEAGGTHMEAMMQAGDMSIFRTCYSRVREANNNKAHGVCTVQNQKGSFDEDSAGVMTNLARILEYNGVIDRESVMPFVSLEGESSFYADSKGTLSAYLKPVGIDKDLKNPYSRASMRDWRYYTKVETDSAPKTYYKKDEEGGFDPALHVKMDALARKHSSDEKIIEAFDKRIYLDSFIDNIKAKETPNLGEDVYPTNNRFAENLETAIKIVANNQDTKVITIGGGLGGWDDHSDARDYVVRSESLFKSLRSAMAHLKALGKEDTINIMVFSEFGRNVNLNAALGWDHGNLQNVYILGGKKYFNHRGIVGETELSATGAINRMYMLPKSGTYEFEPMSIAATIYGIYGVTNAEQLTNNNRAIEI